MFPYQLLAGLAAVVVAAVGGYFHGVSTEKGAQALSREAAVKQAVDQLRDDLKVQETLAVQAAERNAAKRYKAREVKRELAKLLPRPECDWNATEQRLLNDLYDAYFPRNPPGGMQGQVRQPAQTGEPSVSVGSGHAGMGLKLQKPAR